METVLPFIYSFVSGYFLAYMIVRGKRIVRKYGWLLTIIFYPAFFVALLVIVEAVALIDNMWLTIVFAVAFVASFVRHWR